MSSYTEIRGCIHIHFPLKEIEKSFAPLGKEGTLAGLDFLVINSHTPRKNISRYEKLFKNEGYYGKTLVIKGEETDDRNKQNHLLVIGGKKWHGNMEKASHVLSGINNGDFVSFVAHPDGFHKLFLLKKEYRWEDWEIDGFTGIEIWSMLFDWAKETRVYNIPSRYLGFPGNLRGPNSKTLSIWDKLSLEKKIVGIAGLDIHALPFLFRLLDINRSFRYRSVFRGLRNHLLLRQPLSGNAREDKKKILAALRNGSLFFANDLVAESSGFYFGSEDERFIIGDTVNKDVPLVVKSPAEAKIRIVLNGCTLWEGETALRKFTPLQTGIFRVEATLDGKPWVFSNHIRAV